MSGTNRNFTGGSIKVYAKTPYSLPSDTDWEDFVGTGKLVVTADDATNSELEDVADIGDQAVAANTINYAAYGESSGRQATGIPPTEDFVIACWENDSQTVQASLRDAAIGTLVGIAVVANTGSSNQTMTVMQGTLAARRRITPLDAVAQWQFTVALAQGPIIVDQS